MIQYRRNVFETNSSSTHAICINNTPTKSFRKFITFGFEDFGWETCENRDPYNYLWTAINSVYANDRDKREEWKEHLSALCQSKSCECEFLEGSFASYDWDNKTFYYLSNVSIDHDDELTGMLEDLFSNETLLEHYLTDCDIVTGNDNSCDDLAGDFYDSRIGICTCYWKGN